MADSSIHPTEDMLNKIHAAADQHDPLTVGNVMDSLGPKSFASVLLLIGLVMMVPGPADIPGVPIIMGLVVIAIAGQMVLRHEHLWIPTWMERKQVKAESARTMVRWLRKAAYWLDRLSKPRYQWLFNHAGVSLVAIACVLVAMTTPVLELIPFSANVAGAAIAAFALALIAKDGLIAGVAITLLFAIALLVIFQFVSN